MKKKLLLFFVVFISIVYFESCLGGEFKNKEVEIDFESLSLEEKFSFLERQILKYEDDQVARMIDNHFKHRGSPLYGLGHLFVKEAKENDVFPLLLPAISIQESQGGLEPCRRNRYNVFGWKDCRPSIYSSFQEFIEAINKTLGGNSPAVAHLYKGKKIEEKLKSYNSADSYYLQYIAEHMYKILQSA